MHALIRRGRALERTFKDHGRKSYIRESNVRNERHVRGSATGEASECGKGYCIRAGQAGVCLLHKRREIREKASGGCVGGRREGVEEERLILREGLSQHTLDIVTGTVTCARLVLRFASLDLQRPLPLLFAPASISQNQNVSYI